MQRMILMITITIQIPVPPMPPTPAGAKQQEPVSTKEQSLVCCRCFTEEELSKKEKLLLF